MLCQYLVEKTEMTEFDSVKIKKASRRNLKTIAALKNEKMYEVIDRLTQQEMKRLKLPTT
jgi:hypothetical protein